MRIREITLVLFFLVNSIFALGQCEYTLLNYTHNDCYSANEGSIEISISNPNALVNWTGPNAFSSSSTVLTNLYAGPYFLTITDPVQGCILLDSIDIEEGIKISAAFNLKGRCNDQDSVDVITNLWGGTPPYSTIWSNGDTSRNILNLPPTILSPHILTVTDARLCIDSVYLWIPVVRQMNSFMSSVGAICKDDNSGEARVFVQEGTPPFVFDWQIKGEILSQENDILVIDSFSSISGLTPGFYSVEITDDMGCLIKDSIEVKSNPNICLKIYKAFSPNDDYINEFWKIENIHIYPEAVISVYDRNGSEVFRRRNYINSENDAFGGKDKNDQPLPSGTYYYVIDLENGDDVFKGVVTIVR